MCAELCEPLATLAKIAVGRAEGLLIVESFGDSSIKIVCGELAWHGGVSGWMNALTDALAFNSERKPRH